MPELDNPREATTEVATEATTEVATEVATEAAREATREDAFEQFRRRLFPRERHATERPDELVSEPFEALRRVARDPFEALEEERREEALRRVPQ